MMVSGIGFCDIYATSQTIAEADYKFEMSRKTTNPRKWQVRPAKTQISLGIRPV